MASPPGSPAGGMQRPGSSMTRQNRSSSRMSMSSRPGAGSRASDEDGKTAVKVAVRIRPPLKPTDPGFELIPQRFRNSTCQKTTPTSLAVESAQGKKIFVFDRVFGEDIQQDGIWEYLSESVSSFTQGYNVSILAYGQSGAGKSYTMGTTGPREQGDSALMGVIPRAAAALFETLNGNANGRSSQTGIRAPSRYSMQPSISSLSSKSSEKKWQMTATYVEIYNESLRDLLLPDTVPANERSQVTIREDTKGRILLTGLHQAQINSIDDLLSALNFGSSIRQTDSTAVNAKSSRSHAVFSLNLVQKKTKTLSAQEKRMSVPLEALSGTESIVTIDSKLHFVDLAGSERLKNTGALGDRAKEGISINAGLASLGKVISQLSSRAAGSHVSYRDSRLTRLLQDSLGGTAITYMVACINPAEFHLSETLNTVQYAQRARAIQSKPQIQQTSDDSDKQAVIDRLRAEVSFLRDQIRLSEKTDRRFNAPQERAERTHEREVELQNQLLDIQENYTALSQRHTKLISEISKARDPEHSDDTPMLKDAIGDGALERLKRSNSFAEAVEGVVLEYEKTIQSLESSLSTTRSSLSNSESQLLERETKIAYMETVQQQLQARIQKAMDREANSEQYLRDLEARVDGITSGEERSTSVIRDLRKELARTKENESSCEEYISTLEERLAEAEQDHELMQREIDRLEHVVERQRSIGKLDNLLYELDHIRNDGVKMEASKNNGHLKPEHDHDVPTFNETGSSERGISTEQDVQGTSSGPTIDQPPAPLANDIDHQREDSAHQIEMAILAPGQVSDIPQSPAQSKFVADKLETVTHELFDLRVEHENTVNDHEELTRKYQIALTTLAELQDAVDEARAGHRSMHSIASSQPDSFLADAGLNGTKEEDGQQSSSRTLSAELSLLGESANSSHIEDSNIPETPATEIAETLPGAFPDPTPLEETDIGSGPARERAFFEDNALTQEVDALRKLNIEKDSRMAELNEQYERLQDEHQKTTEYIGELKNEVARAQAAGRPASPVQVIRRKSSQNIMNTDRASRSIAALRTLALENVVQPDVVQNFDMNINALMTELHLRSERIQSLEAEIASVRKEMEGKMQLINGLTRERSSMAATSPLELSVVSSMRDQLLENETRMRSLQESHASRETTLQDEIKALKASLEAGSVAKQSAETTRGVDTPASEAQSDSEHKEQLRSLQAEISDWRTKHTAAVDDMKASELKLKDTIASLEASIKSSEEEHAAQFVALQGKLSNDPQTSVSASGEESKHMDLVATLRQKVEQHRLAADTSAAQAQQLEQSHASIVKQLDDDAAAKELTVKELETHRNLVRNLEEQLEEHKAAVALSQENINALKEAHQIEVRQLGDDLARAQEEHEHTLSAQHAQHQEQTSALHEELQQIRADNEGSANTLRTELSTERANMSALLRSVSAALNQDVDHSSLQANLESLASERKDLLYQHGEATRELETARSELAAAQGKVSTLEGKVSELTMINEETIRELEAISEKERKSSRLVAELEDQLSSNYDQHQAANNRLSALQTQRQSQLDEVLQTKADIEKELEESRNKISALEMQLGHNQRASIDPRDIERSGSANSNLRKSASHTSLPSPPPAIPLPPLPSSPLTTTAPQLPSPPTSRHQSKDIAQAQLVEDQEARIRTIEKHLFAEKQLTATLEEALTDLEASSSKVKADTEGWKKKCASLEEEIGLMRKESAQARHSLQAVEEERNARKRVEAERANLEARMAQLNSSKKKKKSSLNCF